MLEVCRGLLEELGSHRALAAVRGEAHLDRDLGLGSLERVELMVRLDAEFNIRLPDRPVAEADAVDDLVAAVQAELSGGSAGSDIGTTAAASLSPEARIEPGPFGIRLNALLPGIVAGDRDSRVIEAKAQQNGVSFGEYLRAGHLRARRYGYAGVAL